MTTRQTSRLSRDFAPVLYPGMHTRYSERNVKNLGYRYPWYNDFVNCTENHICLESAAGCAKNQVFNKNAPNCDKFKWEFARKLCSNFNQRVLCSNHFAENFSVAGTLRAEVRLFRIPKERHEPSCPQSRTEQWGIPSKAKNYQNLSVNVLGVVPKLCHIKL